MPSLTKTDINLLTNRLGVTDLSEYPVFIESGTFNGQTTYNMHTLL